MKKMIVVCTACLSVALCAAGTQAQLSFDRILKGAQQMLGGQDSLSEDRIVAGLKEALTVGTGNAVDLVSAVNGYYRRPEIKIPLPGPVKKVETILRGLGFGDKVDEFEYSMNRAAEAAAPVAREIFVDAVKGMTFTDARQILQGRENEATLYFERKTRGRLHEIFKPIVSDNLADVGATRRYQELDEKVRTIPFADAFSFDLNNYVTDGALDGLFYMLAREEQKIRENPAARVTDLLKDVFGSR
ncbi:MAG TPA: DUF4197 domain-containing protein [Desulfobacteraceae bacterium]|jgi:hypothetical protein|nr:DUF4197 domain-containing protein [Desulfobacteraceae bacterium]